MLRTIERYEAGLIQKVTHNSSGETLRYPTVPRDRVGDSEAVKPFPNLASARCSLGVVTAKPPKQDQ